jgi:hypothetical protein
MRAILGGVSNGSHISPVIQAANSPVTKVCLQIRVDILESGGL